ncbi:MAG: T9SS type A sorting domain-containing protein [Bacteroidales bacterium]
MLGQTIRQQNMINRKVVSVNISDLPNGIYFLVTRNEDNTTTAIKFMKR